MLILIYSSMKFVLISQKIVYILDIAQKVLKRVFVRKARTVPSGSL
jgi:hypothetical protein